MPKPGYASFTIATWVTDLLKESGAPGDTAQTAIKHLLQEKLGRAKLKKAREQWRKKYHGPC